MDTFVSGSPRRDFSVVQNDGETGHGDVEVFVFNGCLVLVCPEIDGAVLIDDKRRTAQVVGVENIALRNGQPHVAGELVIPWRFPRNPWRGIDGDEHVDAVAAFLLRLMGLFHKRLGRLPPCDDDQILCVLLRHVLAPFRWFRRREESVFAVLQIDADDMDFHEPRLCFLQLDQFDARKELFGILPWIFLLFLLCAQRKHGDTCENDKRQMCFFHDVPLQLIYFQPLKRFSSSE